MNTDIAGAEAHMRRGLEFVRPQIHNGELEFALRARAQAWLLDETLDESRFEISAAPLAARPEAAVPR